MKIILACNNLGKIKEIKECLSNLPIQLISQNELNIDEVPETGKTFIENALIKARYASKISGLPAIADDSGLSIDALHGAPGIFSARYAGKGATDLDRINKVLKELDKVPDDQRGAQFHCALAMVRSANDPSPIICEGIWPGRILREPKGHLGFGYDPIFYVVEYHCSAAELDPQIKNKISHRARAMKEFRSLLAAEISIMNKIN